MTTNKTRNLSLLDYLEVLQNEYFINEFRSRFYTRNKDREYYKKVYNCKKEKIQNISNQNSIKSIFTSEDYYRFVKDKLFNKKGFPQFPLLFRDLENYYHNGCDVKIYIDEDINLGRIIKTTDNFTKILVKMRNSEHEKFFSAQNIIRIL